ncbi:hypothetical protein [Ekhidna sp. To15]|uniref:hypothetical protein n=1 Tax=Ekhidna sp. To15 TaxID=3395267 RepID=UPI003F5273A7
MKNLFVFLFTALSLLFIACDEVKDETPEFTQISTESLKFHFNNEPVIFPIYGDFDHSRINVNSDNISLTGLNTNASKHGVTFVKYSPTNLPSDIIDLEVTTGNRIIGTGSVQVRKVALDGCVQSAFSTEYMVPEESDELKINLISDVACDLNSPAIADVRVIPIGDSMGAYISIEENDRGTLDLFLNYNRLGCEKGMHEFVFELCLEPNAALGQAWGDPINNCLTYTTALASFEVE